MVLFAGQQPLRPDAPGDQSDGSVLKGPPQHINSGDFEIDHRPCPAINPSGASQAPPEKLTDAADWRKILQVPSIAAAKAVGIQRPASMPSVAHRSLDPLKDRNCGAKDSVSIRTAISQRSTHRQRSALTHWVGSPQRGPKLS